MHQIEVLNVTKQYTSVTAVNGLSFHVEQGEIFALLGPNGAGKSSLVRMLVGFTEPDSGEIKVLVAGASLHAIPAQHLGYLPEDRGLYPEKSVLENLLYFARLRGVNKPLAIERIDFWLGKFDLTERKQEKLKALSKGNQQKVQLITAVIHEPSVVLLDEPFSGLDPINQEKVVVFLSELRAKGMTVILSAHQMAMVEKLADRMLLMNKGEAVLYGSLSDIRQQMNIGAKLIVGFGTQVSVSQLQSLLTDCDIEALDNERFSIVLAAGGSLSAAMKELAGVGELTYLASEQQDLHQLYLHAIESHQRQHAVSTQEVSNA